MGLLQWLSVFGADARWHAQALEIDLARFTCGESKLGDELSPNDYFSQTLLRREEFDDRRNGIEIEALGGRLESVFVTIDRFPGRFFKEGVRLDLSDQTTTVEIVSQFGAPYWIDRSDGEVILFYEYQAGTVELQFEFWNGKTLSHVTLVRDGVLSKKAQRQLYGVTLPWPPENRKNDKGARKDAIRQLESSEVNPTHALIRLPIWLHLLLDTIIMLSGVGLCMVLIANGWLDKFANKIAAPALLQFLFLASGAAAVATGYVLCLGFRKFPARCRKCGGNAFSEGNRPVRYVCQECGYCNITNVRRSWGRD